MIVTGNYIFVHIPKTGGSSIKQKLKKSNILFKNGIRSHVYLSDIMEIPEYQKKFTFCFVRNPYDRFVSMYFSLIKHHGYKFDGGFEEFVSTIDQYYPENIYNLKDKETPYVIPQYKWIEGYDVDFIGRFENLQEDIQKVFSMIGVSGNIKKILPTKHEDWQYYYTDETKKIVQNFYYEDFEKFNYKK